MPGGTVCSVATCRSNSKKAKDMGENLMFFRIPKDCKIQKEWVRKCSRRDKWNPNNKRLCSKHFKSDDYEDEMQARLLNLQPKKLKKDAIPSLFLPSSKIEKSVSERDQRMLRKDRKANIEKLLQDGVKSSSVIGIESPPEILDITELPSNSMENDSDIWKRRWENAEHENAILRKQIEDFGKSGNALGAKILDLEEQIIQLKKL